VSSANLALVRSICADWERGDYRSSEWAHPQIELVLADLPTAGSWTGVTAVVEAWGDFLDAWDGHHIEVEEYRELDDDRVLTLGAFRARGKASGVDLEQVRTNGANLFHLRDRKVTKLVVYFDRGHALADLGLAPGGGAAEVPE
jgi:ketosteroid isomerase-like protein